MDIYIILTKVYKKKEIKNTKICTTYNIYRIEKETIKNNVQ